ncbi:MAG: DUF342 domain-containing protein [Lachnospiraceae bacterium]|nr:DUF342 domain-containing protein [Lachnospiraceae bacterium]
MNSYFRLITTQMGTGLELIPATEGGQRIDINEVVAYLQLKRITQYEVKEIYQAIQTLKTEPVTVMLPVPHNFPENEMFFLKVSEDKMSAVARFIPACNGGSELSKGDILSELGMKSVKYGIDEAAIDAFVANKQYCTDIVVAGGLEPRHGSDASIEYFFNTDRHARPTRLEDGSVDFFNLNTINHCKEGDLLAKLTPEDRGDCGFNVYGDRVKPREVKHLALQFGDKIELSEDKTEIRSKINGHVMLTGDKVFVSDVYEVENVGTATGNITSEGSVIVSGNVQAGFSIVSTGSVEVRGVVEGASITAGGDIIIARGMNGMGKGILKAGGSVVAKFVENATIEAGTFVEANSIMHSKVSAGTQVSVDGKKGFIAGGAVRATEKVECKTLGSAMGADTLVEVGVDPQQKMRYVELQKQMAEMSKKYATIQTTLTGAAAKIKSGAKLPPEQMQYVRSLMQLSQQLQEQMAAGNAEFDQLDELLSNRTEACVCVRETAYAGTKIVIGEDSVTLKGNVKFSKFIDEKGEVKICSL